MKKTILRVAALLLCVASVLTACAKPEPPLVSQEPVKETRTSLLGTVISITLYGSADKALFDGAFSVVADIDNRMSANKENSEISAIGRESGNRAVSVSDDTYKLIERALGFSELCGGTFDITVGSVMELWKTGEDFSVRPDASELARRLPLINYKNVLLSDGGVMLKDDGMKLDLGAIAKGYACDMTLEYLKEQGVKTALLDFGGNIYTFGQKPDGSPWRLGIRSPIIGENGIVCSITVNDESVVTSGGYERYFEEDGTIYHHLLNPKTGCPADSGIVSMTIVDPSSARADALSTACFVLGLDEGLALLESLPDSEGIFILKDNSIVITSGLTGRAAITDERFTMR